MIVSGLVKSSLLDYPGKIACVLFSPGCNLDCYYCHNRNLVESMQDFISLEEILAFLVKRQGLLDAVVLSGGEATLQTDLIDFIQAVKDLGYCVKLDTNGHQIKILKELCERNLLDYVAIDYKAPRARYTEICGCNANPELVHEAIRIVQNANIDYEVRTTVIPLLTIDDYIQMAKELPPLQRYCLNEYRHPKTYKAIHQSLIEQTPYTDQQISEIREEVILYQKGTILR